MKAHFYVLAAVAALVMAPAVPTHAITYGEPDDGEHPYVGFMLFHDPSGWFSCSGSALADDVFLTAGHCLFNVTTDLEPLGSSGGTDAWVTFAEEPDLSDFPATADFPSIELRDEARLDWLQDAGNGYLRGTASPHPLYDDFASFPDTHDVGIAELDASTGLGSFAVLADLGALDENTTGQGHNKITVETAGYGIQEIVPVFTALDARYKSTSKIVNLKSSLTDGFNLHTSNNPSASHGTGGSCFGDSGGPVMFDDTNVVVGVVSFGLNNNCKGADFAYRADITDTQDFVNGFLP